MAQQAKTVCSRSTSAKEAEEGFQLGSLGVDFELISLAEADWQHWREIRGQLGEVYHAGANATEFYGFPG